MIARLDALIGYRLHANIVGYSFKVPRVALGWDQKMEAFHSTIGEPRFLLDGDVSNPAMVVDRLNEALDAKFDTDRHRDILQSARHGVRAAASALRAAVR